MLYGYVFFPNKDGNSFGASTIDVWFHEFWDKLPESRAITGNPARVHDFRHGYAVHRLNSWVKENQDINWFGPDVTIRKYEDDKVIVIVNKPEIPDKV